MRPYRLATACTLALALALGAPACSDSILPAPIYTNSVDTVSLYALDGTPVATQSGYSVVSRSPVRTDLTSTFDFVFNFDTLGRAVLIPAPALHVGGSAGLQAVPTATFEGLRIAPGGLYITDREVVVVAGSLLVARSRLVTCNPLGNLYHYAKIGVIDVDLTAKRIRFAVLANINCGYRSLEPGRPTE
jgi:hypothetical protein